MCDPKFTERVKLVVLRKNLDFSPPRNLITIYLN